MLKSRTPYNEYEMMHYNLAGYGRRSRRLTAGALFATISPILFVGVMFLAITVPGLEFFAECQNVAGGDLCTISIK